MSRRAHESRDVALKRPEFDGDSRYLIPISRLLSLGTA
ncbi:Hypothetical protein PFR_JS13-2_2067 [Propionibacterium freudenreichii]|nr:Hypothetical protein PFR_JS11_2078 [Propionibacterium freudenreichii]SCQ50041.1 Hypothetical protein PFR_JS13-1_2080 [Propionibacterium freudenreichii]SCQ55690.1 Hypothetical protein PFR_JS13-2_2067 [Propionibacterium freudenreichii]